MDKLEIVKCACGHKACATYHLNIGTFSQGNGFTKDEAQLIVDAVNNTAGQGIDPNAVVKLLEALKKVVLEEGVPDHNWEYRREYMPFVMEALEAAKIK